MEKGGGLIAAGSRQFARQRRKAKARRCNAGHFQGKPKEASVASVADGATRLVFEARGVELTPLEQDMMPGFSVGLLLAPVEGE